MMTLTEWAIKHGVGIVALHALQRDVLGLDTPPSPEALLKPQSETAVQAEARLVASKAGHRLWRNNVGALLDDRGVPVRYGLCNDSKAVNDKFKSSDLIGIEAGTGRFLSFECKPSGWRYTGTEREQAQLAWIGLINSLGGRARFITNAQEVLA
jgi:hypothetical protein